MPLCRSAVIVALLLGFLGVAQPVVPSEAKPAPNFVFFLIDDLGWRDTGVYGSRFYETPNIDRLAGQGMRFTQAYAACCVCSPTRASILTGRYPARLHLTDWIAGKSAPFAKLLVPDWTKYLPLEEITLAEALKAKGYTTGIVGKWHLGGEPYYPEKQGFDFSVGGGSAGSVGSHFFPYMKGGKGLLGLEQGQPGEYLADRLTTEAETFLDRNKDKPFFLYFAHYAVHTPIQAKQEKVAKYQAKVRPDDPQKNAKYAAMIESVDESVGRILKKLDDLGLADRTVVFFMSDNGGLAGSTSNAPLRGSKGMLYEGGIREPMIVRWPGVVPAGAASDAIVTSVDFFPTILEMAGVDPPADRPIDGRSFLPALTKPGAFDRGPIFWHYPHYHAGMPGGVVRQGDFKLIEFFEDGNVELYNLKDDLGETKDLAPSMPKKADEMKTLLANWRQSVGAQMMSPNPNYDPAKTKQSGKSAKAPAAKPKKKAA